jgi:hypothetical protein
LKSEDSHERAPGPEAGCSIFYYFDGPPNWIVTVTAPEFVLFNGIVGFAAQGPLFAWYVNESELPVVFAPGV